MVRCPTYPKNQTRDECLSLLLSVKTRVNENDSTRYQAFKAWPDLDELKVLVLHRKDNRDDNKRPHQLLFEGLFSITNGLDVVETLEAEVQKNNSARRSSPN